MVAGDPLMVLEDFDQEEESLSSSLSTMGAGDKETEALLTHHTPSTKYSGVIHDMNVFWSIPEEDMSESCQKFIAAYKKRLMLIIKEEEKVTGKPSKLRAKLNVVEPYRDRIQGAIVSESGGVVVEYFIKRTSAMGVGDKLTYNSSLKSIIAYVLPKGLEPYSEFGDKSVDATLGAIAVDARMVTSIFFSGILGKILYEEGRIISEEFFDETESKSL
jgi:DNA-directed RNA polymerase beta subunit